MPETDEAARQEVIVQIFRRHAAGFVVKVDQYIPAKDYIEATLGSGFLRLDEIDPGETHRLTEVIQDLPLLVVELMEIAGDQFR